MKDKEGCILMYPLDLEKPVTGKEEEETKVQ